MKKRIKLNESELRNIISESVKRVLKESLSNNNEVWDLLEKVKECLGADEVCNRLVGRDPYAAYKVLKDIYSIECGNTIDDENDFSQEDTERFDSDPEPEEYESLKKLFQMYPPKNR